MVTVVTVNTGNVNPFVQKCQSFGYRYFFIILTKLLRCKVLLSYIIVGVKISYKKYTPLAIYNSIDLTFVEFVYDDRTLVLGTLVRTVAGVV